MKFASILLLMVAYCHPSSAVTQVTVSVTDETVLVAPTDQITLACDYSLSTTDDLPVTVTWKVGDGPRTEDDVISCTGYTKANGCSSADNSFGDRATLDQTSLTIVDVSGSDNRMFWCQISLEGDDKAESLGVGMDIKSVALTVQAAEYLPRMHSVNIAQDVASQEGDNVTISCDCEEGGYHCDDIRWYKGPSDVANTDYEPVYSKIHQSRPLPIQNVAHGDWNGRATLEGKSLVIQDVTLDDSGRYWCEIRAMGYVGIGEMATDAKSTVLQVNPAGSVIN